jgi:hypothetical protein
VTPELKTYIVTRDFNRMLADLAAIAPQVEFSTVIKSEAAAVMRSAMAYTRVAEAGSIRARWAAQEWTTFGGKKYKIDEWLLPNPIWKAIRHARRESLQTKLAARGLSKQSWVHLAASFGAQLAAPAFVINANYRSQQYPIDTHSREEGTATTYLLSVINASPIVQFAGGREALLDAMARRASYFRKNIEHGVFSSVAVRAQRYPGIFTSPVPPAQN